MYQNNDGGTPESRDGGKGGLMLKKQAPASTIPRFNPHGYQPPPQEKKKEDQINSPGSLNKKFGVVKKRQDKEETIDFSKINIEDLLLETGVEFRNPAKAPGGWLPLEAYDNKELDSRAPKDWMIIKRDRRPQGQLDSSNAGEPVSSEPRFMRTEIPAQGLWRDRDGLCFWRKVKIQRYLVTSERYEGYWENTKEKCRLHRIFILFDEENPIEFAKRFKIAYDTRTMADSLLKYNFYIENMPTHQIPEIGNEEVNRILSMTQNTKQLRGKSSSDTTTLLSDVNFEFAKTLNKIIFDKHLKTNGPNLISGPLTLPQEKEEVKAPFYGMITIPPHNFPEQWSNFCFNSILNKDQAIRAMQEIRKECNDVLTKDIYNPNITKSMSVTDFKQIQKSATSQIAYHLKETWVNRIKDIVKTNFAEDPVQSQLMGRPWYSLNEDKIQSYEAGKLKKFLQQTKFVMQDTLQYMTQSSVKRFVAAIVEFVPIDVKIIDSFRVENTFYTEEQIREMGAPKEKIPLFQIDLTIGDDRRPKYSSTSEEVIQTILTIYDDGIKSLQEISQVEQKLLPHLFKNSRQFLKATVRPEKRAKDPEPDDKQDLPDENSWAYDEYIKLKECIARIREPLDEYVRTYDRFQKEYEFDPEKEMKAYEDPENWPEVDVLRASIIFHQNEEKRLQGEIPEEIICSIFKISTKVIRNMLAAKHKQIAQEQIELVAKIAKATSNRILEDFAKASARVESVPKGIEELSATREFMNGLPKELEKRQGEIKNCMAIYEILDQFYHKYDDEEEYDKMWRVYGAPQETVQRIEKQQGFLEKEKERFIKQMNNNKADFQHQITELDNLASTFKQYVNVDDYELISQNARSIKARIDEANEYGKVINNRENLVGEDITDYTMIGTMAKEFKAYYDLWTTVEVWRKNFSSWLHDAFDEIDSAQVEEIVENSNKLMAATIRFFKDKELPDILRIAEDIKKAVDEFRPQVPIVIALRTEGMKDRHWEMMSQKLGFQLKPYEGFTYAKCMEMNLVQYTDAIVDVGERAGKEYNIETSLAKMKAEWVNVDFGLKPFKNTGTDTITGFEEAMMMLDEHTVLTQTMAFSPFKKAFEAEIEEWDRTLLCVSECIDEWKKCQGAWMYLQPIFDSPDIVKQLPSENKKFKSVDKNWKACIQATREDPNALRACTREGLLKVFVDANRNLDLVGRGLRDYLESKRSVFARFYFLSNDELLEILSQTKEVENVRPHLRKVFENLMDVTFQPNKTITAMFSGEKEEIAFYQPVDPRDKGVEFWMGDLENMMFATIKNVLDVSVKKYLEGKRTKWMLEHPGQCVLNGSQVHWTNEVETAITKNNLKGYLTFLETQLLDTVELVRKKLTKLQSITLGALITIDVHAKDVIKTLVGLKIDDVNAFEWISQLRYYWEDDNCRVKCIQTNFPYGYEYLGNTFRLVITPLTDKCYMTLMGALKLNLGGAPAGPAGTGKTETTKDLAKALAKQCVVFNCSDGMDYIMIGKFFKGLAASGAWACFDEFNRINVEVLSVVAQQLQQLFDAKGRALYEIDFEESKIRMKPTFCAFITMNPGYAGRSELPDNLKALFRPVAMMVPDYALIAQISLYSFGYAAAGILSVKMVTTFKLNSEQLSSQDHYDYGMRAVKSVINAAGLLKRSDPDMPEDQLLLRALRDVNVPKFLKDDLPLFENIITDLFPGVERPNINYGQLMVQMKESALALNKQPVEPFLAKIVQLYDTIRVRHGLMIVGPTGGGKTANYKTLAHSMSAIKHLPDFEKVNYFILNPKSILMGQMYGDFDPQTGEWQDGILAKIIQDCAKDESPEKNWVMFDGPVDAIWIENMNTVLDDNKKLCLNSGQIITLTDRMTMMFEVEDLAVASPATVSRCGMVYMEPGALGNEPLIKSWLNTCPESFKLRKNLLPTLEGLFKKYLEQMLKYMRKNCVEPVFTVDNNLVQSLMRILDCYFADYHESEVKKVTAEEVEQLEDMIEQLFVFALTWSIGCTTNLEGRQKFNQKFRQLLNPKIQFPEEGTIYDYVWDKSKREWVIWTATVEEYYVDKTMRYSDIVVPTFDSIRMQYLKRLLLLNKKHVLCPGPTGTGKTVNVEMLLATQIPEEYQYIPITFSAQTSANQIQDALDEKFEKRRKGVYGPPTGKRFIIFIDDLNMPKKEEYGAQPPLELLRQWLDHQGWYDRSQKEKPFMRIEDIIFVSAMGPPGGGRSSVTQRLQRHFNFLTYTNLGKESVTMIFSKILKAFIGGFSDGISGTISMLVDSTQAVFAAVAENLKPTPSKSHYTFNLRDISKIFQGVCSADAKRTQQPVDVIRLWIHESQRVFGDRMINDKDKDVLLGLLLAEADKLSLKKDQIFNVERIIFGDYLQGMDGDSRPYVQITDLPAMLTKIEEYLEDYNAGSKHPMKLVMFLDACDHVSKICRILRQPQGNALLLGVGGSGRQSLSKLATFMSNFRLYQIEVIKGYSMSNWRDNLKFCLMQAGVEAKVTSFLFVDTQIINEQMLEDINNVLNSGDVPQLYKTEDYEGIYNVGKQECQKKQLTLNKMNMFGQYLMRVKANIHCIIAMSPLGETFRTRLLKFPSLVNCCTIDWFSNWPEEALLSVGMGSIEADVDINLGPDKKGCVQMFKIIHQSVEKMTERYLDEMRRINYVTPTSYLELLATYKKVFKERTKQVNEAKNRLSKGLNVLAGAAIEVAKLQQTLKDNQPELERTQKEVIITKEKIAIENKDAMEVKKVVMVDEAIAAEQAAEVKLVKDGADADLAKALPGLEKAVKAVKEIDVGSFYELQKVGTPGMSIVKMFEVVCMMFGKPKPKKPTDPKKAEYDPDGYFELAKKELLSNPKGFLANLINFEKDNMPDALIQKVIPMMDLEALSEDKIKKASQALAPVRVWVIAMTTYHETLKIVNPKRAIVAEMTTKLDIVMKSLNEKRAQVAAIDAKLAALSAQLQEAVDKEAALNAEIDDCGKKLVRAEKMIGGLAGEKERWTNIVADLTIKADLVTGDSLVASGAISYSGSFTSVYREELEAIWRKEIKNQGIKATEGITMSKVLGDDVTIRQWGVAGLPSDKLSIENGIIMFKSRRWPLMIDPQTQANKFIKNLGGSGALDVFKQSETNLIRGLEMAIQFGRWVLLENVGEDLDPALEPVLLQQKTKQGSGFVIKLGEKSIPYNETFKFFLTTTLPNPHYSPETQVKISLLNFAITAFGLEEQMLNQLVKLEFPELQAKKDEIVESNAKNAKITYELENKILHALDAAEEIMDLLKDDDLIDILADSKQINSEIEEQQKVSAVAEKQIDEIREAFRTVARRASLLFFCIVDLAHIDPMYQYSLQWFQRLFTAGVRNSEQTAETDARIQILNSYFTLSLYQNVCRSLFEAHKLLFSFLLTTKILFGDSQIDLEEWRFFLAGPSGQIEQKPNPTDWLDDIEWSQVYEQLFCMSQLDAFRGIDSYFIEFNKKFKKIFDAPNPHEEKMPGEWDDRLNSFQKMIVLKSIRADKVTSAIQNFIVEKVGKAFIDPPTFNLKACYADSSNVSPLIFVLSPGSDPIADLKKFAEEVDMLGRLELVSLGQGQAPKAEKAVERARLTGGWALLQNCHLSVSWMPALEGIVERLTEANHPDYRIWLTSMPSPHFPVSVLQTSVKMTMEPPTGLRSNLLRTYANLDSRELSDCAKPGEFKKLMFAFSFFHAVVQDRRRFGPIGWNIPYAFTFEDFDVCRKQLKNFLDDYEEIPYKVLNYLGAEVNYGGRVTDDKDIRLIKCILERFVRPDVQTVGFKYSDSGAYRTIEPGNQADYMAYIDGLPLVPHPEAFGLHENAEITTNQSNTREILEHVLSVQPRSSSGAGKSREDIIADITKAIEDKTPAVIDFDEVVEKYPTKYEESMNTVLAQEVIRYNKLLVVMARMLKDVQKALKGEVVMSEELDQLALSMFNNQVPAAFGKVGPLSLKPLSSWINDLNDRIDFINKWIAESMPPAYWLSGFFFPQAFFTGALQNYARKKVMAIDELDFDFKMYDEIDPLEVTERPDKGVYCYGLYFEGARWNKTTHMIDDSKPKQLYVELPLIWFKPAQNREVPLTGIYKCPVYKVLSRTGTLSTTGHSTNFVMWIELPTKEEEAKWVRGGVAAFLALRY